MKRTKLEGLYRFRTTAHKKSGTELRIPEFGVCPRFSLLRRFLDGASGAQLVEHAVVAFVTCILEVLIAGFSSDWKDDPYGFRICFRIVDVEFVADRLWVNTGKPLDNVKVL